jgi:hypothetical protein
MRFRDFLPLGEAPKKSAQILEPEDQKAVSKLIRATTLALGFQGTSFVSRGRSAFEPSPYDFDRIIQAVDTDSYVRQSFMKFRDLFWKEGWDVVGENPETVDYIYQRLDFMEIAMQRPFQDFLSEVVDQLVKFHNVFIVRSRGDLEKYFPGKLSPPDGRKPIVGYYIIPVETVEIMRDAHNRPVKYRQRIDEDWSLSSRSRGKMSPEWMAKDVIHLRRDQKTGRAWGTPYLTAVLDDVVALRQLEEDTENLVHRELFPLYKYSIGSEDFPASQAEIEKAANTIEDLRVEGGLILPERHDVDVIGGGEHVLDADPYLKNMKERVANGLGMFPLHLGMMSLGAGSSAVADRMDIALYDRVKEYQSYFADQVRLFIFNELLYEGGYDPMHSPKDNDVSDRCLMQFHEIDVDTQVKKETHSINKANSNIQGISETRGQLGMDPQQDESDTMAALQARLTPTTQVVPGEKTQTGGTKPAKIIDTTPPDALRPNAQKPSKGGRPNMKNTKRGSGNVIRPTNQFGSRTSPNIRHDDNEAEDMWLDNVVELLDTDQTFEE